MKNSLIGQSLKFSGREVIIDRLIKTTTHAEILLTKCGSIIKYIPLHTTHSRELYQNETTALRVIGSSPNIIELEDFCLIQSNPPIGLLKLEYYEFGSLSDLLKSHIVNEIQALQIMRDLICALSKLEEAGIVHRNITMKNILISKNYEFGLSGFGSSGLIQDLKGVDIKYVVINSEKHTHPATRPVDFGDGLIIEKIDIWGLGCILHMLLYRTLPTNKWPIDDGTIQYQILVRLVNLCLNPDPNQRPTASSMIFQFQHPPDFVLVTTNSQFKCPSSSIKKSLYNCLDDLPVRPDMYFLQSLTSKSWTSPEKVPKILEIIRNWDKKNTIPSIKILLVLHRLVVSGHFSFMSSVSVFENVLKMWTDKIRNPSDVHFNDFYAGLIRQMSRVMLEKIALHMKISVSGNWKQMIPLENIEEVIQYLLKVVKICEGLAMGTHLLVEINNFIKTQLLEELQRAVNVVGMVLGAANKNSDVFSSIVQRMNQLLQTQADTPKAHKYKSQNEENPGEELMPNFPALVAVENKKTEKYLDDRWKIKQEDLNMEKVLAAGSSCTVYKGKYKCTPVAIKVMKGTFMGKSLEKEFEREVTAMVTLRHPNLVLFMGACKTPQMIIISEFCAGGSLFTLLHESKNIQLSWKQRLRILRDVARGMLYLHEASTPILHRDLKSLNVLLVKEVTGPNDGIFIKITDFGISRILDQGIEFTGQMGTCHWMAPEVLSNQPYSLEADIYSYGIVMWEVIAREVPYQNTNPMTIPIRVVKGERPNLGQIPSTCPEALKNLLRACWDAVPTRRPNFHLILDVLENLETL
ncbi:hypothetical protein SteCoe_12219 [Stentor coeruleus]|uniref:Protein kinase domain-containing protein n=1 Tax=Stentor coeruleus TaxID=5963 RepID=A0A1R2CBD4_9CILI|nr:hypothetical protein SteCoe_12219 [Stentor coeruleus]